MLNEDQLKEIEEMAALFFTEEEVEEITGTARSESGWNKAFRRGTLKAEASLRKSIISLANDGSSPAQTLAWKMLEVQKRLSF